MEPTASSRKTAPPRDLGPETYRLLFERSPLPMWVFDVETFAFVDVNSAAMRHYGYSRQEFLGMTILDIRPEEEVEPTRQYVKSRPGDSQYGAESTRTRHRTKGGRVLDVEIIWERLEVEGRPCLLVLAHDISANLEAARALETYRDRLEAVVTATSDAIWDWDLDTNGLWWGEGINRLFGHITGYRVVDIGWWSDLIHPEDRDEVLEGLDRAVEGTDSRWSHVYRFRRVDGTFAYVHDQGTILRHADGKAYRMIGGLNDITDRVNARRELVENEQRFRALARASHDAIWEWDIQTGKLAWNEGISTMLRYEHTGIDASLQWWRDRIHPDDATRVVESLHEALETGRHEWTQEYRFMRGDNVYTHVVDRGAIIRDELGNPIRVIGGMNDITERLETNRLLEENRVFIEKAQQVANMGSWRCILHPAGELVWSANVYDIFGVGEQDFTGTVEFFYSCIHPEDLPGVKERYLEAIDHGTLYELDHRIIRPGGEVRWVREYGEILRDEKGNAVEVIGVVQDITDRKLMEEALRRSEKRFKRLFDSNLIGILIGDMQGVILDANDAFLRMIGRTRHELENGGIPSGEITVGGMTELDHRAIEQLRQDRAYEPYEKAYCRADGSVVHVLLGGMMLSEGEELTINFAVDITELVETRRSLEISNESLEQKVADRTAILQDQFRRMSSLKELADNARAEADAANRAKSESLSRMSHELRTPMNAILGFAQLLELDDLPGESAACVAQILKAGDHLLTLINEVLDLSQIESGRLSISPERVLLSRAIAEVIELCRPTMEKYRVAVHWAPDDFAGIHVMADANRLRQVFLNLMSNAAKYNRECGSIHITVERTTDGTIRTCIRDTGIGIPPEKMDRLFRPFDRLDRELSGIEGSGLGLALTKRLIDVMNGRFEISSVLEEGTTVTVDLVAAKAPAESRHPDESPSTPFNVPRILEGIDSTVLYIEDNLSNIELVQRIFQATGGVRLLSSLQGGAGIDIALESNPDLILLDLNLPDIDGLGVLRRLRADVRTGDIPVIVITADANPQQRERLLNAGANDFLTKPINVADLVAKVKELLEG